MQLEARLPLIRFIAILLVVTILISAYWTLTEPWVFAKIPGDIFFNFQGLRIYIAFGTSLIITTVISFVLLLFESGRK